MSCKFGYIEKLDTTTNEKERLTKIATEIWQEVKDFNINGNKVFRKQDGSLYNTKNFYVEAQNKVSEINKRYGTKVIDMISGSKPAYRQVLVNVSSLMKQPEIQGDLFNGQKVFNNKIKYELKAIDILQSNKAEKIFNKGVKNNWSLDKILTELQVSKAQKELILEKGLNSREEIIASLLAENSFTVEVNLSKTILPNDNNMEFYYKGEKYSIDYFQGVEEEFTQYFKNGNEEISEKEYDNARKNQDSIKINTQHYKNLSAKDKQGNVKYSSKDWSYQELEIKTPNITPNIKGHSEFSTDNGIGWFRVWTNDKTKEVEIQEVQSDLFQKGRNEKDLISNHKVSISDNYENTTFEIGNKKYSKDNYSNEYWYVEYNQELHPIFITKDKFNSKLKEAKSLKLNIETKENKFLQLLNKKGAWVNFFIQSIVQDSAKKGYKTVRFPLGETAARIEGHDLIADKIKDIDYKISKLGKLVKVGDVQRTDATEQYDSIVQEVETKEQADDINKYNKLEIKYLEKEKQDLKTQGLEKLSPIQHFYENVVSKKVKQLYKDVKEVTDEEGNKWLEVDIRNLKSNKILLNKDIIKNSRSKEDTHIFDVYPKEFKNRDKTYDTFNMSNLINSVVFNNKSKKIFLANEIINNILTKQGLATKYGDKFLNKLKLFVSKSDVKFRITNDMSHFEDRDTVMAYSPARSSIFINKDRLAKIGLDRTISSIIHEFTHVLSINAYLRPSNFTEEAFRDDMDAAYAHYKDIAGENDLYGFTSVEEFIAEVFSNKEFQDTLKNIDKNKITLFKRIITALRRLFNLPIKTSEINYNNVFNKIVNILKISENIGLDQSFFKLKVLNKKEKDKEHVEPDLTTQEGRLKKLSDKILDALEGQIAQVSKTKNSAPNVVFLKRLKNLVSSLDGLEQLKSLIRYSRFVRDRINELSVKIDENVINGEINSKILDDYKIYTASYGLIEEVNAYFKNTVYDSDILTGLERNKLSKELDNIAGSFKGLQQKFEALNRKEIKKLINTPMLHGRMETIIKKELESDYKKTYPEGKEINEWVAGKINSKLYQNKLESLIKKEVEHIIHDIDEDISDMILTTSSELNMSSKLINILSTILAEIRQKTVEGTREYNFMLSDLYKKFINGKSDSNLEKLYEKILDSDSNGKRYLYGEFKPEFLLVKNKKRQEYLEAEEKFGADSIERSTLYEAYIEWLSANTTVDKDLKTIPNIKWRSKKRTLSEVETEVLSEFKRISRVGHTRTFTYNSLIKQFHGAEFIMLPSMTRSNLERIVSSGDIKGIFTDKYKDVTQLRGDDIGFAAEPTTINNIPIKFIPVHYRGQLDTKDQSIDLFTMYALENKNTLSFNLKKMKEVQIHSLLAMTEDKDFYVRKGVEDRVINLFAKRTKFTTQKGIDSNTLKKMKGMVENNLYAETAKYAGKMLGGKDINKVTREVISVTTSMGLMGNMLGAMFNPVIGNTNSFLEAIAGDVFTKKNMKKAAMKYFENISSSVHDITKSVKKGYVNQLIEMFDIHGDQAVLTQGFLRQGILKSLISPDLLTAGYAVGEHEIQGILTMAVLDSLKVLNSDSKFIDKEGKVTSFNKAATALDMLKMENGILKMNSNVIYTSHTPTVKYTEGGKVQIHRLIMQKVFDTQGVYNTNYNPEVARTALGKLFLIFRRFLFPALNRRFIGYKNMITSWDELEGKLMWQDSTKQDIEGSYVSTIRYFIKSILPAVTQFKYNIITADWENMNDNQRGNIKRTATEIALATAFIYAAAALKGYGDEDDENKEAFFFFAYMFRRSVSEIEQFVNPLEAWKIVKSPSAAIKVAEKFLKATGSIITPWSWDETYQTGKHKGDYKLKQNIYNIIPVVQRMDVTYQESYNWIENN